MRIAFGSDHAGASLKKELLEFVASLGHEVADMGGEESRSSDYPRVALAVATAVASGQYERGILVCGSGLGMSIAANKVQGIRAALCHECYSARMSREHNDANILCLGQRVVGSGLAREVVQTFLGMPFSQGENHRRRLGQISEYEQSRTFPKQP
ncbi:MAG: ribose 5-phosphate isomerase B [Anaerolineae bacterium]